MINSFVWQFTQLDSGFCEFYKDPGVTDEQYSVRSGIDIAIIRNYKGFFEDDVKLPESYVEYVREKFNKCILPAFLKIQIGIYEPIELEEV
jgi:hypothetical protein